jgi:transketolase
MFAKHHKLDNLVAIIDYNRMQAMGNTADVLDLGSLTDKFCAFGWNSRKLDGHDHNALCRGLSSAPYEQGKPTALIAMTIKGKGVSFMENQLMWHYKSPNDEQLMQALTELGGEF